MYRYPHNAFSRCLKISLLTLGALSVMDAAHAGVQINPYPEKKTTQYEFDRRAHQQAYEAQQDARQAPAVQRTVEPQAQIQPRIQPQIQPQAQTQYSQTLGTSSGNTELSLEDVRVSALSAQRKRMDKAQVEQVTEHVSGAAPVNEVIDIKAIPTQPVDRGMRDPALEENFDTAFRATAPTSQPVDLNAVMMKGQASGQDQGQAQIQTQTSKVSINPHAKTGVAAHTAQQGKPEMAYRWSAVEGADVQDTLHIWADSAGVDFVWNGSNGLFDVEQTTVLNAPFEDAVRHLLDQYKGKLVRPYGRLFVNPQDGRRVLVVDVKRGV